MNFCKGCGVQFKYADQGSDYHSDECADMDIHMCHLVVVEAARVAVDRDGDLDYLISALERLDDAIDRIAAAKAKGEL